MLQDTASALVEKRDGEQDQHDADRFGEAEGDGEQRGGEEYGGQRLDGTQDADGARPDV